MDDKVVNDALDKIRNIVNECGFKNVIIGFDADERFWGAFDIGNKTGTIENQIMAFTNAARLYQAAREKTMNIFDRIARGKY